MGPLFALAVAAAAAGPLPPATRRDIARAAKTVAALDRAMPLTRAAVANILGSRLRCRDYACDGLARIGRLTDGHVDFRGSGASYVLVLDQLGGVCLPLAPLAHRFGATRTLNGCTDGAVCLYSYAERRRGMLGFHLSDSPAATGCIGQIVFNSNASRRRD